jgi:hypothetical protein
MTMAAKRFRLPITIAASAMVGAMIGSPLAGASASVMHKISGADITPHSIAGNRLKPNTVTGAQIKESTLAVVPKATVAESTAPLIWHPLKPTNGWVVAVIVSRAPAFAVSSEGIVYFRGGVDGTSASSNVPFVMPKADWPSGTVAMSDSQGSTFTGKITVTSAGLAEVGLDASDGSYGLTSLDGLQYALG